MLINCFFLFYRGCNLQTCTYVTNPTLAFSNQSGNYDNLNSVFDRFARNQAQFQQLNGGQPTKGSGYHAPAGASLSYPTTNSNNQSTNSGHQMMGLPATNTLHQSRINCSSPASNSSMTSKSSPSAGNFEDLGHFESADLVPRTFLRFLGKFFFSAFNDAGESFV